MMPIYIMASQPLIFTRSLYAADAIHAITAIQMKVDAFITYDSDFTELKNIPILNPSQENFQNSISLIKTKYSEEKEK